MNGVVHRLSDYARPSKANMSAYVAVAGVLLPLVAALVVVYAPWATRPEEKKEVSTISGEEIPARGYTESEAHGAWIYAREGCATCHTKASRSVGGDVGVYGPAGQIGEYAYDNLKLVGVRRVGPDLSRIGGKYTTDELIAFFLAPRARVPGSIMPNYPWLFDDVKYDGAGNPISGIPTVELLDLIGYLQSLGSEIGEWRKATAEVKVASSKTPDEHELIEKGKDLFGDSDCVSCHGAEGKGDGPTASIYPAGSKPANFASGVWKYGGDDASVRKTISEGRSPYMPPHPQFSPDEIAELSAFVRSLGPKK